MVYLSRACHFKFFKGCLPQISLGPFLNTLSHVSLNMIHSEPRDSHKKRSYIKKRIVCNIINDFTRQYFILRTRKRFIIKAGIEETC